MVHEFCDCVAYKECQCFTCVHDNEICCCFHATSCPSLPGSSPCKGYEPEKKQEEK